jgi:hypothetical protein
MLWNSPHGFVTSMPPISLYRGRTFNFLNNNASKVKAFQEKKLMFSKGNVFHLNWSKAGAL